MFLLKVFKNANFKRCSQIVRWVQHQSGRPRILIYADMVWCALRHGAGYYDYANFGFWTLNERQRATYVTRFRNKRLLDRFNDRAHYEDFNDKHRFLERFSPFMHRQTLDLTLVSAEQFRAFIHTHPIFFAKRSRSCGGKGVRRVRAADYPDGTALLTALLTDGLTILEAPVEQHPTLSALHPQSVNTLRIVTDFVRGEARIAYIVLKVGRGEAYCDNSGCGGLFCRVDPASGVVLSDAIDDNRTVYTQHPDTLHRFCGLHIPFFGEALQLALRCAAVIPEIGHIGWDIAITPTGAELVEGNADAGVMCQFAPHTPEKRGLWPYYKALFRARTE